MKGILIALTAGGNESESVIDKEKNRPIESTKKIAIQVMMMMITITTTVIMMMESDNGNTNRIKIPTRVKKLVIITTVKVIRTPGSLGKIQT